MRCTHTHKRIHMYMCTRMGTHKHTITNTDVHRMGTHKHTSTQAHTHTRTLTCTHVYTRIHTLPPLPPPPPRTGGSRAHGNTAAQTAGPAMGGIGCRCTTIPRAAQGEVSRPRRPPVRAYQAGTARCSFVTPRSPTLRTAPPGTASTPPHRPRCTSPRCSPPPWPSRSQTGTRTLQTRDTTSRRGGAAHADARAQSPPPPPHLLPTP